LEALVIFEVNVFKEDCGIGVVNIPADKVVTYGIASTVEGILVVTSDMAEDCCIKEVFPVEISSLSDVTMAGCEVDFTGNFDEIRGIVDVLPMDASAVDISAKRVVMSSKVNCWLSEGTLDEIL